MFPLVGAARTVRSGPVRPRFGRSCGPTRSSDWVRTFESDFGVGLSSRTLGGYTTSVGMQMLFRVRGRCDSSEELRAYSSVY